MMRQRKPRINLIGFENSHGIVVRAGNPNKWIIECKSCGLEHEQASREIQNNNSSMSCNNYKPYNYTGLDKRDVIIRNQYGITLKQYELMLDKQKFKCAICGKHDEVEGRRLAIDHCHTTGKVRGLLCGKCNRGLGLFYDNEELLQNAIKYLKYALAR
jgi:transcription elongation factor Elf1